VSKKVKSNVSKKKELENKKSKALESKVTHIGGVDITKAEKVRLLFKENRSYTLHINRELYQFTPNSSMIVSVDVIKHPDFLTKKKRFVILEIKK